MQSLSRSILRLRVLLELITLFTLASVISSCRNSDPTGPDPNEAPIIRTTVAGTVVDEVGKPVSGATVTAYDQSTTTDKFGFFILQNVNAPNDRCVAIAKHDGYFAAASASEDVKENGLTEVKLFLMSHGLRKSVSGASGGTLNGEGNSSIKFEPAGIVTSNGSAFTGDAQVAVRYLDPTDPSFAYFFTGGASAIRENGDKRDIFSYGVLRVDIRSASGEQLQLAPGKPATLTYPVPPSLQGRAPATLQLWYFDEAKRELSEAGVVTKQGNTYVGSVAHFSDWSCGVPEGHATVVGTVTCGGSPVMGIWVRVGQAYALTNELGMYRKFVPANAELQVAVDASANHDMFFSDAASLTAPGEIESITHDIQLTSSCPSTIRGRLTDDQGQAIPGRLAYVTGLGDVIVATSFDGHFEMHVPTDRPIPLEGMSWICPNTKIFTVTSGAEGATVNVGDLQLCGQDQPAQGDIDVSSFEGKVLATLTPDGSKIGIMAKDPMLVMRNAIDGSLIKDIPIPGVAMDPLLPVRFSIDGSKFIIEETADGMGPLRIYETASGALLRQFDMLRSAMFMPDGKSVIGVKWALLGDVSELQQLSIETGEVLKTFSLDDSQLGEFTLMGITSDAKRAVVVTVSSMVVFDLEQDMILTQSACSTGGGTEWSSDRSLSADGSKLAMIGWVNSEPKLQVIETSTGNILYTLDGVELSWFGAMAMHPNGKWIVLQKRDASDHYSQPLFIDITTGDVTQELTTDGAPGIFHHYSFSADGKRLIGVYRNADLSRTKIRTWNF